MTPADAHDSEERRAGFRARDIELRIMYQARCNQPGLRGGVRPVRPRKGR